MLIRQPDDIKPSEITSKADYLSRRRFINAAMSAGLIGSAINTGLVAAPLKNVIKSPLSTGDEELTDLESITTYNNFLEFGNKKEDASKKAGAMTIRPWTISVDGECNKPGTYDIDDIVKPNRLEERIYRLRCIEAWSMVIPWVGFPLADVLKLFEPNSNAKFVTFTTLHRPEQMPGQKNNKNLQWPYHESLRIDEAMHPLTILAVGLYGEDLLNQNGAPIRLIVPWKYGIKGPKSIVKISFIREQPETIWTTFDPKEFGFYSNVNPEVDHPRWSQARERRIGKFMKQDTLMFNGYADQVASMYTGMDLKVNF